MTFLLFGPDHRASLVAQLVKNLPAMQETPVDSWVGKIRWRRDRLPTPVFLGFLGGSAGKEFACSARDLGSILGLGRSPEEGKATCSSPSESTIKTKSPVLPYKSVTLLKFF